MDVEQQEISSRRPSVGPLLDRPTRAPFGPRIRTRLKHSLDVDGPPSSPASIDPSYSDVAVQAQPPSPLPPHSPRSAPATFIPPPPLTPPPTITFDPSPIPWKGLPLEVAQWTFSSSELQEIVSRAIRLSARESFVRLLSLQALEVDIVHEQERLDAERATAQARWRFEVGRRTMLIQALNAISSSSAASAPTGNANGTDANTTADSANPILGFVTQLASSIATCDSLLSSIISFSDQQSQIEVIQHQHWASALGIALRKLNKAHERQAQDLARALARVQTLEDELEEAWREAEKMAIEFDDLEQEIAPSDGEDDPDALADPPPRDPAVLVPTNTAPSFQDLDDTGTLADIVSNTDIAVVLGVTATAVASKATLISSGGGSPRAPDKSDAKSVRSIRSRRSTRDSHLARLSAARLRSRTASNASLRLPKSLRSPSSPSVPIVVVNHEVPPPMPALPPQSITGCSFLDMDQVSPLEPPRKVLLPKRHPEPKIALPMPPHSAGLPQTRVPSVWLETEDGYGASGSNSNRDGDKINRTRLNGLDRTHSLNIFSSLSTQRARRSNLVMSLTGSGRRSESDTGSPIGEAGSGTVSPGAASPNPSPISGSFSRSASTRRPGPGVSPPRTAMELGREQTGAWVGESVESASPTSDHSLMSLAAHVRGPSNGSSGLGFGDLSMGMAGMGTTGGGTGRGYRPGSAGARLTTTIPPATAASSSGAGASTPTSSPTAARNARTPTPTTPKRSLVSRASEVILRRLSHATTTNKTSPTGGAGVGGPGRTRAGAAGAGIGVRTGVGMGKKGKGKGASKGSGAEMSRGSGGLSPSPTSSRSRSHEALRLSGSGSGSGFGRERGRGRGGSDGDVEGEDGYGYGEDDGEGEVMVIGSLRSASASLELES